jgi:hypothetical protein
MTLVAGFNKCKEIDQKTYGVEIWIDIISDTEFVVFFDYRLPTGATTPVNVNVLGWEPINASCTGSAPTIVNPGGDSRRCTKTSADVTAAIRLVTDQYSPRIIPKFPPFTSSQAVNLAIGGWYQEWVKDFEKAKGTYHVQRTNDPNLYCPNPNPTNSAFIQPHETLKFFIITDECNDRGTLVPILDPSDFAKKQHNFVVVYEKTPRDPSLVTWDPTKGNGELTTRRGDGGRVPWKHD